MRQTSKSDSSSLRFFSRLWVFHIIVFLAAVGSVNAADAGPAKRVLIVSTGSRFSPGFQLIEQSALDRVRQLSSRPIEFYPESLDIVRFPSESYHRIFRGYLFEKYNEYPPDLILLFYVGKLTLAQELLGELFPAVPVVVAGLTEEDLPSGQLGKRTSGLTQRLDVRGTIELILRLQPQTRRIVVVGGTADVDRAVIGRAREAAQAFKERGEFEFWADRSLSQMREEVRSLPSQTAVVLGRMYRDGAGEAVLPTQVAQAIVESANAPLYVLADTILGTGAVGGSVVDVGALGKRVGEIGARILDGSSPKSFPFEVRTTGVPLFDWRALKRWGISESRLPPGSAVRFRPPSMWEQYRRYIIGALAIIALQAGLIIGLLLQRARRHRAEKQLRESQEFMELSTSAADLGLWVRDLEHSELSVNHRLRSLFGLGQTEGLRFEDVLARIHPDDRARVITEMERTQKTGVSFEEEFRVMVPDGSERWVAARGRTVGKLGESGARRMGVVFDITGRKRAEQDLNAALVEIRGLKERLEEENIYLKEEIFEVKGVDEIVGKSDALKYVLTRVEQVAQTDATVLLLGETGVGKELIAQAIHEKSSRSNRPLINVNCATLPEALVESELFGHERGSFTGADRQRKGRFELADGGTILLDEVGELAAGTQAKLLRVLQEGEFERVGGSNTIKVNVRVIAATNRKLHEEVPAGRFRQDLFYRLNVYPITVPPLRDRREDIPMLVSYFARQIGERLGKGITEVPAQVMRELTRYDWPGNIRELQNVIERAVIVSPGGVLRLPEPLMQTTSVPAGEGEAFKEPMKISTLDEAERDHILRVLEATGWRINGPKGAAAILKMHPSTLRFRMKKLGLTKVLSYTTPAQKTNLH